MKTFYDWCIENNREDLLKEWHPTKNGENTPHNVGYGCNAKHWWICSKGHEWDARPSERTKSGCPYCSNKRILIGYNDLATTHPEIAKQWHPTKNGNLKPTDVVVGSRIKVWWKCEKGHEWEATVHSRTSMKTNCPICSNKKILVGYNDFATTHPEIAKQWHPTKNGDLKPTDFTAGSQIKVWWQCEKGHEWETRIYDRKDKNCPYCSNRKLLAGLNDLETTHPEIAKEWHLTKNGDLKPTDVFAGSEIKVWWQCEHGHEWNARVSQRKKGSSCPYCSNKKVISGHNDLASVLPEIAKEWHPTKNGDLKPNQISVGSHFPVWWKCSKCGYEYQEEVRRKIRKKYICKNCKEGI